MEHRQLLHTSPAFEMDHNESRNYIQSSMNFGTSGPSQEAFTFHTGNMRPSGANFSSRSSFGGSNEYIPAGISMELSHPHAHIPGPSYVPFQHPSSSRSFCPGTHIFSDRPSSSHHSASSSSDYGHSLRGYEDAASSSGNGRGPYKRRRATAPVVHERVRYHSGGSSSDMSLPFIQKPSSGSEHWPWEVVSVTSSNRGSSLSIRGEGSQRNVRTRSNLDLDVSQSRANVFSNPPRYSNPAFRLGERPGAMELANLGVSANTQERSYTHSDDRTRIAAGPRVFTHDANQFRLGGSGTMSSLDANNHRPSHISGRNPVVPLPHIHFSGTHALRGSHSSYIQRAMPAFRVTPSYLRSGHRAPSLERVLHSVPDSYSSMYSRPYSTVGGHNNDWSRRLRTPYQRSSTISNVADAHDRLGFMMLEHSTFYDSRNLLDQHRDMRLDVDNMSYEELLALEERIGNVSTGLSEDRMSNCLRERIHYASDDETEEESNCVICLEEYKNKDVVATLVNCSHDYHTGCIKKWLSMKKVCPICKAPVVADS